ncbi:Acetyltransferase (GNAT) domain-containing protein [Fictibacillus solisalsi]|uniref:Acetyltransferase (GNAT) domain-containing protein n=1 Tax=Fictibacillus solisalsi TaxID=459525 RepID=A0A1G9TEC6_9BACL|nr:GNAT family N-acetyltransferase [Fictibacillus solisalsi]SDM45555.1 Acetyltransferase (GNAT) domain-containing protein [Fictibacillus solisalsi]
MYKIDRTITGLDWNEVLSIYHAVGWTRHTLIDLQTIYSNSSHVTVAYADNQLAGIGRALSDGVFNAAIYDVIIHPQFQRKGVGKLVVEDLLYQLQDISCVHLISTSGNQPFYEKAGLKKAITAMGRYLNKDLEAEYLE